jgi:predicted ATPase/DNA-binding SARP family transcriptional activator
MSELISIPGETKDQSHAGITRTGVALSIRLLGGFAVVLDGNGLVSSAWGRHDARRLLIMLALHADHSVRRTDICAALWPELDKSRARMRLSNAVYALRNVLEPDRGKRDADDRFIHADNDCIELRSEEKIQIDVESFETYLDTVLCNPGAAETRDLLEQAVSLYQGPLCGSQAVEEWYRSDRALLEQRQLDALRRLANLYVVQSQLTQAAHTWEALIRLAHADESAHRELIKTYLDLGRPNDALQQYKQCRDILASERGAAPEDETVALLAKIHAALEQAATRQQLDNISIATPFGIGVQTDAQTSDMSMRAEPLAFASNESIRLPRNAAEMTTELPPERPSEVLQANNLIGRHEEIAALQKLLGSSGSALITITGLGGVGKTSLALHIARLLNTAHDKVIHFVDLSSLNQALWLPQTIAKALGISGVTNAASLVRQMVLLTAETEHPLLLILDNFEHLLEARPLVEQMLLYCPAVKLLVTSRLALQLPGERVFVLEPLSVGASSSEVDAAQYQADVIADIPAVAFFIKRARDANHHFRFDSANAQVILALCRQLDGLPLAIELAAARSRLFAPAELLERISRSLGVLHQPERSHNTRHASLEGVLNWSHDLLAPQEKALLASLCVFAGGFTLETLEEAFAAQAWPVADLLETLLDHQLVVPMQTSPDHPKRWTLLMTVENLMSAKAEYTDIRRDAQHAHAKYFAAKARQWDHVLSDIDSETCVKQTLREHLNLLEAYRFLLAYNHNEAIELGSHITRLLLDLGLVENISEWLKLAEQHLDHVKHWTATTERISVSIAHCYLNNQDIEGVLTTLRKIPNIETAQLNPSVSFAAALLLIGTNAPHSEQPRALEQSLQAALRCGNDKLIRINMYNLAECHMNAGNYQQAQERFEVFLTVPDSDHKYFAMFNLAELLVLKGQYHDARQLANFILRSTESATSNNFVRVGLYGTRILMLLADLVEARRVFNARGRHPITKARTRLSKLYQLVQCELEWTSGHFVDARKTATELLATNDAGTIFEPSAFDRAAFVRLAASVELGEFGAAADFAKQLIEDPRVRAHWMVPKLVEELSKLAMHANAGDLGAALFVLALAFREKFGLVVWKCDEARYAQLRARISDHLDDAELQTITPEQVSESLVLAEFIGTLKEPLAHALNFR